MTNDNAIRVQGLSFGYTRKKVLKGVDLDVPEGQVTALVGANGAGKSTLLAILAGVEPYRAWWRRPKAQVRVLGLDPVRHGNRVRAATGYVPDRTDLPKWMRIRDHFKLLRAFYPTWDDAEAARLLAEFDLDPSTRYAELSKGQRALENLAAELAHRPRLLLLDEPFSGLDPLARRKVLDGVIAHLCEDGRTVLLVSHSIADVERCADRVALFSDGRVTAVRSVEELRASNERGDLEEALVEVAESGRAARREADANGNAAQREEAHAA